MCKHELTRCDSRTEPFYHMMRMITVERCIKCGEQIGEKRDIIGSLR